jgi:hypothetical protein
MTPAGSATTYDDERDQERAAYAELRTYCHPLLDDSPTSSA